MKQQYRQRKQFATAQGCSRRQKARWWAKIDLIGSWLWLPERLRVVQNAGKVLGSRAGASSRERGEVKRQCSRLWMVVIRMGLLSVQMEKMGSRDVGRA